VVYLVILVIVAVAALLRLWLQQRREQTQMDTIEGFSSALEAMAPPAGHSRRERAARRDGTRRTALRVPRGSLLGWFVAAPSDAQARAAARRRISVRRTGTGNGELRKRNGNGELRKRNGHPAARGARTSRGAPPRKTPVNSGRMSEGPRYRRRAG